MVCFLGHNTDGKYFVTSNKMSFRCETRPRKVNVFIEKARDGHIVPVTDVEVRELACGANHTVGPLCTFIYSSPDQFYETAYLYVNLKGMWYL